MLLTASTTIITALVISFSSWLSGRNPQLAGFIVALPISTMLVLLFSYAQYQNPDTTVAFAKSIFLAIPLSLLFFVPFLLANKLNWGFWSLYLGGFACLTLGYFAHKWVEKFI